MLNDINKLIDAIKDDKYKKKDHILINLEKKYGQEFFNF